MDEDFTSVKLPWESDFPMRILTLFLISVLVSTVLFYKIIVIFLEKVFYAQEIDDNVGFQDQDIQSQEQEIELANYKFKIPGIIRKITGTYFAKSNQEDVDQIKKKVNKLLK